MGVYCACPGTSSNTCLGKRESGIRKIRMPRQFVSLVSTLLFLLALVPPHTASGKDSITWMEVSMPPYFIQDGPAQGQGYGDLVTAIIQAQLPEYDHHKMVTNVIRHFDKFKQGEKVCTVGLYRTPEREAFMHFSIPSLLTLPPVLIIKKETRDAFAQRKSLSLDDILQNQDFIIGLSKDRSYGNSLDAVFNKHRNRKNFVIFSGQELSENFFKMLMLGRVDGLIGLPDEAMYYAEKMGIRDRIVTLTLEETQHGYAGWSCAVGCSKNEWGLSIIEKINKILVEQRPAEGYRAAYERWLDANSLDQYRRIYQEVFLQTTPPGMISTDPPLQ